MFGLREKLKKKRPFERGRGLLCMLRRACFPAFVAGKAAGAAPAAADEEMFAALTKGKWRLHKKKKKLRACVDRKLTVRTLFL